MSDSARTQASRLIRDHVLEMPEVSAAGTIAAYYSIGTEPDTHGLIFGLWKRGSYVVLPVLMPDGDLDWASYEGPDSLAPGPRGLLRAGRAAARARHGRPGGRRPGARPRRRRARVPARPGRRVLDRALARVGGQVPTIALLYDDELLPTVPTEAHDQRVRVAARPGPGLTWLPPASGAAAESAAR